MSSPDPNADVFRLRVRTMQIIAAGLISGLLLFLGVALYLVQENGGGLNQGQPVPVLTYLALGFFAVNFVLWLVLPERLGAAAVRSAFANEPKREDGTTRPAARTDAADLTAVYQTKMIIGLALLEGAGFLAIIAYLQEGQSAVLAVVGVIVLIMLATFPTVDRVRTWTDQHLRRRDDPGQG